MQDLRQEPVLLRVQLIRIGLRLGMGITADRVLSLSASIREELIDMRCENLASQNVVLGQFPVGQQRLGSGTKDPEYSPAAFPRRRRYPSQEAK